MKALFSTLLLLAVFLSACSGLELSPQPQAGEGWEFLAWAPSPGTANAPVVLTSQVELDEVTRTFRLDVAMPAELERVSQVRTPNLSVDFETEVVLALASNSTGNCGGPVYLDISFTDSQVLVEPFRVPPGTSCTLEASRSISLFALDRSMLPASPFGVVIGSQADENMIDIVG